MLEGGVGRKITLKEEILRGKRTLQNACELETKGGLLSGRKKAARVGLAGCVEAVWKGYGIGTKL